MIITTRKPKYLYSEVICFIIINLYIFLAPSVFALAFSIVKKFLNEYTISKIQIFKANPVKWIPILRDKIKTEELPKHYGGDMIDPNGDPRCPSKVRKNLHYKH